MIIELKLKLEKIDMKKIKRKKDMLKEFFE